MRFSILANMERFDRRARVADLLAELADLVQIADDAGFETAWFAEHHGVEFTVSPAPLNMISHLAGKTKAIRLGTAIVTAPYWHPLKLAGEAAQTDIITGGRLELGVARGAYQYEFNRMAGGIDQKQGGAFLREMVPALKKLWTGDYAHAGECWNFPSATSVPKPLQKPHPPLWIAARDIDTHRFAIANGCNVMATPLSKPDDEVFALCEKFRAAKREYPRRKKIRLMMSRTAFATKREAETKKIVDALIHHGRCFETLFQNAGAVRGGFAKPAAFSAIANRDNYRPETVRKNQLIGAPDDIIARLKQYEKWGVDQFCLHLDGSMPAAAKARSLSLFAAEVAPEFKEDKK
jgi:alkanesulfonate monooxygenase SsuD/methylene tetrahydromethanopterin reductase-like flavin-dependent oxidoreductase (luciferase family)